MNANKRPLSLTILAWTYIAIGSIGFAYHLHPIFARHALYREDLLIELTEVAAILSGAFILRGDNWARWLALGWIGFHVLISFFDSLQKIAVHTLFFVVIGYFLFRSQARAHFQPHEPETKTPR